MNQHEAPISEAFVEAIDVFGRRGHAPLKGKIVRESVGSWVLYVNATSKAVAVNEGDLMGIDALDPYSIAIFWNGWLAGILDSTGGVIAAGSEANEDRFITDMREAP